MKKRNVIGALLLIAVLLAAVGVCGYYLYMGMHKTPDEVMELENQKTEIAYKENLGYAMNARREYEFIVVLNPAHGGMDCGFENAFGTEKEVTLAICNQVMAANTEKEIGIFLTRSQDVGMDENMRLEFYKQLQPDLFIDIHLNKSSTGDGYGTRVLYYTDYYNRKLSNTEFADLMEKSVVSAIEGRALGIQDVSGTDEVTILKGLMVPAVSIVCGDMAHETEGELLTRESYQKNMAEGILDGIYFAKDKLEQ